MSSRNLRLTATSVCRVCESGSLVRPRKNIIRVITAISEKNDESIATSLRGIFEYKNDLKRKAVPVSRMFRGISNRI
jgi:hypothetical protein